MELTEAVNSLNNQLIDLFGIDTLTGQPIWRIVWSEDQFEKRMTDRTPEGLQLLYPVVTELPKYKQWIHEKYILERLVLVPYESSSELADVKQSYEPIFVYQDPLGRYLPPTIGASKFVIDTVYAAQGKRSMRKYVDDEDAEERVNELQEELFGNETDVGDALAYGEGVVVPGKKEN